jgi:hypothetical protein
MNANDVIELLNTIRDNASQAYQDRVPEATRNNIEAVGEAITDLNDAVVYNEFIGTLANMIYAPELIDKSWSNPLGKFKKGKKTFGDTVEEIYNNFIKAQTYDQTGAGLLTRNLPDTKTIFHRMNRKDKYKLTDSPEALAKAFKSYEGVGAFIQNLYTTIRNSAELDEYILMRQLFAQAYENKAVKVVPVADPQASEANAKAFIKTIKTISGLMEFPSSDYNGYLTAQSTDNKPIITFSKKNEQILILDVPTDTACNVDVLAFAFGRDLLTFNTEVKQLIDVFPVEGMIGALVDKNFFQVYDDLFTFREFDNPEGLYRNHLLHVWQTVGYSCLTNAVFFVIASDQNSDGDIADEYTVTYSLKDGITSTNKRDKVNEGMSYKTTLKGDSLATDTVTVTMGGETITTNVYTPSTGVVKIDKVTGNIVITVA